MAKPTYTWGPTGAKIKALTTCDNTTIIKFGGFFNAGNSIAYPTPYHWSGVAPRDTFDIDNVTIIDDSLTQFQTVNPNTLLSGSTLNWDVPVGSTRNLVFRDGGATSSSWFDKTKWAAITFTAAPNYTTIANQQVAINYSVGATGECPPVCGDVIVFDNSSFTVPTNTLALGANNSAYVGTIVWNQGVAGNLTGASTSVLNICNSLYFSKAMSNSFQGQTVFTAVDSNKVEFIQSGDQIFNNQILFSQRTPSKYKIAWKLLDSLRTLPIANAIIPAVKINKGTLDTRGQKLSIVGGIDLNSIQQRGLIIRNSKMYLTGGRAGYSLSGNGTAFLIGGDYTKLIFKADSSDIVCESVTGTLPSPSSYSASFYTWNGAGTSQFYTVNRKGLKFNKVESRSNLGAGGTTNTIYLRSDTINNLTTSGRLDWTYFYKGYIKKFILTVSTSPFLATIGNNIATTSPLYRFKGQIDTVRISDRATVPGIINWDTLYVKDEFTILPGSSLRMAQGGLTWFHNGCNVNIIGTAALPIAFNPGAAVIGTSYNYPSGNRVQNEHYFRKDSGVVCTDYTQLYNIWAIGNGNGNNSCTGGASWGCGVDAVATNTAYGTWMNPIMTPTTSIRTLSDTTFFSSETPNTASAGRARFTAGSNADYGYPDPITSHNTAGWDGAPYAGFPPTQLTLSQSTVCPNTVVSASLALLGTLKGKDFPITMTYSIGGVLQPPVTFTSALNNPFTFTFTASTTNTSVTWVDMTNQRCFNNVQAVGTNSILTILPSPTLTATASNTVACAGTTTTFSASGASSYTWSTSQTTASISVNPTVTTTYSVVGTNTLGCYSSPPVSFTINVNALPTMSVGAQTNVSCFGQATGAVTLTPSGGSGSGYSILPTSTVNLSAGTYTYNVQDGAGCTSTVIPVTITQPAAALTAITSNTANTNCITPNGILSASPSGGTSSYNYVWSPGGATTQTVTNLNGGTYTVVVTDNNNCTYTTTAIVSNPSGPAVTATTSAATICSGANITITPSGGTSYTIVPSIGTTTTTATDAVFTPTSNTTYTVFGTDATSCLSNTVNLNITVNTTPTVAIASISNPTICSGNSTTITPSGATNYSLTTGTTTLTTAPFVVNPTADATYTLIGTSTALCPSGNNAVTTVTVNATPTVAIASVSSPIICSGSTTTITPSGASSYTLTSSTQTLTSAPFALSPMADATYTLIGTSSDLCPSGNNAVTTITVNTTPTVAIAASNNTICSGATTTLTASGANTYNWTNPVSTNTIVTVNPSTTTIYTVTGLSAVGSCTSAAQQVTVTVNALPILATTTINNVTCFGLNNGTATFTNTSGTPGYTVTGTNVVSNTSAPNLSPGTYTYMVTDAALCVNTLTLAITQPTAALLATAAQNATNTSCTTPDGVAGVSITGGTVGYTIIPSMGTPTGTTITGLGTGVHSYTITDNNGCTVSNTISIAGATGITSTLSAQSNVLCNGNNTASVTISGLGEASGVYNYTLTNTTTSVTVGNNTTGVFTNLPAGTYSANIVGNVSNCISSQNITITQPTAIAASAIAVNSVICVGGTATASITPSGGTPTYSINWNGTTSSATTQTFTAGIYSVNVTDANNCPTAVQSFTVTEPTSSLSIASVATTTTGCGLTNGTATITPIGGWNTAYTYSLNGVASTNTVTNLAAGTYTALVIDNLGCTISNTFAIVNPSTPTLSIALSNTAICIGQTATLTPSGALTYTLASPSTTFTANTVVAPVITGSNVYSIIGTDGANCVSAPSTVTITVNALPTLTLASTNNTICAGQTTTLTANGATTYTWTNPVSTNTVITVNPSTTTIYTVTGTSAANCTSLPQQITINVNALPTLTVTPTNVLCNGGTTGSVSILSSPNTTVSGSALTGLAAGSYTYIITNTLTTCASSSVVTIAQPTAALTVAGVSVTPNGNCITPDGVATVTVTGGTSNYQVMWSNGVTNTLTTSGAIGTNTTLNTGVHTFTVTDANGCTTSAGTLTLGGVTGVIATAISQTSVNCYNATTGAATFTTSGTGPFNYTLTNTATSATVTNTTGAFTNLSSGNYSLQVVGLGGCVDTKVLSIVQPTSAIATTPVATNSILCFGGTGTASLTATGGTTTYTYTWQSNASSTNTATYTAGVYSVTVNDANGCASTKTFTIAQPSTSVSAVATSTANSSCVTPNGIASITASGGTPTYTYNWSPSASTGSVATSLGTGIQSYTITDANGCKISNTITINGTATPSIATATQTNVLCNGATTGAISLTVAGGTTPYTTTWSVGSGTNLQAGVYTATVTDAGSCKATQSFTITEPTAIIATTGSITSPCPGQNNGSAEINIVGGTPNYNVNWSPTSTSTTGSISTISNIKSDNYTATITDANGCVHTYVLTVNDSQGSGCDLEIPEIFSPNGDTKNDTWVIKGLENFPNNTVQVFNRWGDEVYNQAPYKNDWNGTNFGAKSVLGKGELPSGTYYFILTLNDGEKKPITGYVQLVR